MADVQRNKECPLCNKPFRTGDMTVVWRSAGVIVHTTCRAFREGEKAAQEAIGEVRKALAKPTTALFSPVSLLIPGVPRTKKNSGRIVQIGGKPRLLPSAAWEKWAKTAIPRARGVFLAAGQREPIAYPVNCRATFYRDALRGDAVGFYQALADVLEEAGVVQNDRWIVSWDGSRLEKDAKRPRVELVLEAAL